MSICVRNGTRYNRHKFSIKGLSGIPVCEFCGHVKGGIFESGDSEIKAEGDSSGVAGTEGQDRKSYSDTQDRESYAVSVQEG